LKNYRILSCFQRKLAVDAAIRRKAFTHGRSLSGARGG